jgi:hypothetical protein
MKTIKEIAPYLPYDLGIKILNYKSDYIGIEYSTINGFYYVNNISHFEYKGGGTGKSIGECKLLMRPLSDLTKPCLEDGKIPCEELAVHLFDVDMQDYIINKTTKGNVNGLPFWVSQKLFEWKFDMFGLIEKGIAIDINTLNIPNEND